MRKIHLLLFILLFSTSLVHAQSGDTLRVISHDKIEVVTDPSKGENSYTHWARFPEKEVPIRQILLKIKFACPDNMRCADWDYVDHITIKRQGGLQGEMLDYEIARMLTPYGGAFDKDWEFEWKVDVTDFSLILRDSVEIEYKHTGYEPNQDRGWKVTLAFELIEGKPSMEPVAIHKVYQGSYAYGNDDNPINESLAPFIISKNPATELGRFRVIQTGHGMDRPDGCGEFCDKFRDFLFDGKILSSRQMWKQCGSNPLYPQAGTWIFDRANWCPGDLIQPDLYDVKLSEASHSLQLQMEDYSAPKPSASELISAYLIEYKHYESKNDVSLEEIIIPSDLAIHSRQNPAAFGPTIVIKNNGSEPLKKVQIKHGQANAKPASYTWTGLLAPGQTDTLRMEGLIPQQGPLNYQVELLQPNGKKDGYALDNKSQSHYSPAPAHNGELILYIQTNQASLDNAYTLTNSEQELVNHREHGSLEADSIYRDSLHLPAGNYRLHLTDSAGDGLEFWYKTRAGRGKVILLNGNGEIVKSFDSDFGNEIIYDFIVSDQPDAIPSEEISLGVFPTRAQDYTIFDFLANQPETVIVKLVADPSGEVVEEHRYQDLQEGKFTFDLSRYPKSRYFFQVYIEDKLIYNKRLRVKE